MAMLNKQRVNLILVDDIVLVGGFIPPEKYYIISQIGSSSQHIPTIGANKSHVPNHQAVQKIMCHNPLPHDPLGIQQSGNWPIFGPWFHDLPKWIMLMGTTATCQITSISSRLQGNGKGSSAKAGWNPFLPCSVAFTPKHQLRQRFRQLFHLITASDLFWLPINGGKITVGPLIR